MECDSSRWIYWTPEGFESAGLSPGRTVPAGSPPTKSDSTIEDFQEGSPRGRHERFVKTGIPEEGRTVELSGFADVVFPAGAFEGGHTVTVYSARTPETRPVFEALTADTTIRPMLYEIRINTSYYRPVGRVEAEIVVDKEFLKRLPEGMQPWAYPPPGV